MIFLYRNHTGFLLGEMNKKTFLATRVKSRLLFLVTTMHLILLLKSPILYQIFSRAVHGGFLGHTSPMSRLRHSSRSTSPSALRAVPLLSDIWVN